MNANDLTGSPNPGSGRLWAALALALALTTIASNAATVAVVLLK